MAEYTKEIGVAATVAVLAAIGIGIFALNAFPSGGSGISNTQTVSTQATENLATRTSGAVVTTLTTTQLACPNNPAASIAPCLYLYGWAFNYTGHTLILNFGYQGSGVVIPVTLNITFSGSQSNAGFTESVSLDSLTLPSSDFEQPITSPVLPNLQNNDQVVVTITGTAGMYFTTNFTATPTGSLT